jgi:hypothetical protein
MRASNGSISLSGYKIPHTECLSAAADIDRSSRPLERHLNIKPLRAVTIPKTFWTEIAPLLAGSDYLFLPFTIHGSYYWCVWWRLPTPLQSLALSPKGASAIVLYRTSTSHTSSVAFINETTLAGMVRLASRYLTNRAMVKLGPHLSPPRGGLLFEA